MKKMLSLLAALGLLLWAGQLHAQSSFHYHGTISDCSECHDTSFHGKPSMCSSCHDDRQRCATIQDGTLVNAAAEPLSTGYDTWGYNYQARIFNGGYCDAYRDAAWCQPWKDDELEMKWNDAWLSNSDCDGDGKLDRHFGFPSYVGSGAYLTNHQKGSYLDDKGKKQRWTYFVKIVAAPADAQLVSGTWYAVDGTEIGPAIWNEFATIQEVYNDTGTGDHGVLYLSPYSAGFGRFSPEN